MAKEEAPAAEEEAPKKGKGKLLIIIAAVVAVLVIGGGVAAWLMLSKAEPEEGAKQEEHAEEEHAPIYEKLETFTVNLADQQSYLQTDIQLMLSDAKYQEKIKAHLPEVRDALIRLLSSRTSEDLAQQDGKDKLAEDIAKQVNEVLGTKGKEHEGVKKVLFGAFIIQ
ncbi:MAG TPA: flagellar basal body-associated protein FliL [Thiobacillaceae bacterium]|nr:flagellar basal body-associated protein FliL [Thiobacillaceae bacterium]HNA82253.1 flagellar basal body-associated protein FliL [Thiobacillaceae bacterium]HNF88699.1 flagellar basal body-associated protein FliL [Thiobacillaceae bacterium]HNH89793.1 flagellar basal body-associated protein FliL [Thiobacillaceae bacterium]HNI08430.1 flagellar basal body-associated protein FliL [Thiobacillaceae bacterium]